MFPTPEQLRAHAAHARQMAAEYRAEGNTAMADRRLSDAEFYEAQADFEDLRPSMFVNGANLEGIAA